MKDLEKSVNGLLKTVGKLSKRIKTLEKKQEELMQRLKDDYVLFVKSRKNLKSNIENKDKLDAVINLVGQLGLTSNTRKRNVVIRRQIFMHIIYHNFNISMTEIGDIFNKDHSTVIHALKCVKNMSDMNDVYFISAKMEILKELDDVGVEVNF